MAALSEVKMTHLLNLLCNFPGQPHTAAAFITLSNAPAPLPLVEIMMLNFQVFGRQKRKRFLALLGSPRCDLLHTVGITSVIIYYTLCLHYFETNFCSPVENHKRQLFENRPKFLTLQVSAKESSWACLRSFKKNEPGLETLHEFVFVCTESVLNLWGC